MVLRNESEGRKSPETLTLFQIRDLKLVLQNQNIRNYRYKYFKKMFVDSQLFKKCCLHSQEFVFLRTLNIFFLGDFLSKKHQLSATICLLKKILIISRPFNLGQVFKNTFFYQCTLFNLRRLRFEAPISGSFLYTVYSIYVAGNYQVY